MTETTPEPTAPGDRRDPIGSARRESVRGYLEAARLWAHQQGFPVPTHGPLPDEILARYRRQQTRE